MGNKRPIVVILGVHRSGTSLVANFMHAIGVDFGEDLLPADEFNEAGYWESRKIFDTHAKILRELNCDWHNPPVSFPVNCWRKPRIQELKNDLLEFVRSECKRTEKIWGFKDPRTAVLLPMWREIFDELQVEPHYILTIRHPGSVAASLSVRDRLALSYSQALWLRTNLDVMTHTRKNLRAIVDYDRWFDSGLDQARTLVSCLNLSQSIEETQITEAANQVISPGLRHHQSHEEQVICSPIVAKFYSLLRRATINGKIPDEIWAITETFERSSEILGIWDDLARERDAIFVAERDATISQQRIRIDQLKKQKKLLVHIIISIVTIFSLIFTFMLFSGHNWLK